LDNLLPQIDENAVKRAIKSSVCNIYHACVHNLIYEKDENILKELYKSASFVVQAIWYIQSGEYIKHQHDLLYRVNDEERKIVSSFLDIKKGEKIDFELLSNILFQWSKYWINRLV
ncbi:MAG: nucleotidyltransferase domain-containing protein, partial [Clostridiales bacterium]|nr:nucleotidyltransferase domain-containing protein [Clostridiales bacterium]